MLHFIVVFRLSSSLSHPDNVKPDLSIVHALTSCFSYKHFEF